MHPRIFLRIIFYEYKYISDWSYINEYPIEKSNRTYNTPAYYNIAVHCAYEAIYTYIREKKYKNFQ